MIPTEVFSAREPENTMLPTPPTPSSIRILDAFERWCSAQQRWGPTVDRYRASLLRLDRLGLSLLADVSRERVSAVQSLLLARGLQLNSVRAEMNALASVLHFLDDLGELPPGLVASVRRAWLRRPRVRRRRTRFLSRVEFDRLAQGAAAEMPRLELPIRVAALAGPRVSELARMRGEDVQPGSFRIETLPEWGAAGSCKTGPRVVPVCRELRELLETRLPREGWMFPSLSSSLNPASTPFTPRASLELALRKLRRWLGMPDDITWTVLRHTRASWWLQGGASIYKVADWMGHTVTVCERYYGSLVDGYDPECERSPAA